MNIFSDFHHNSLFTSLQMLFEVRLNHQLFRPIGEDWYEHGFWKLAEPYKNNHSTIIQYLGIRDHYQPKDGTPPLNEIKHKDDYYTIKSYPFDHKAIILDQFKKMKFDIIIASYQPHIEPYLKLIQEYQPQAKLIHQQGNEWAIDFNKVKNLLASVKPYKTPEDVNKVFYHQEFDLNLFSYESSKESSYIRSFINTLSTQRLFEKDWQDFLELETYLPEYIFESYGAGCSEGVLNKQSEIAEKMKKSKWIIHLKNQGDGYGHLLHNSFAVGRPVIYRGSQYKDKLGERLLEHLVTGIDLDIMPTVQAVNYIREQQFADYVKMCENVYNRFIASVDFNKEQKDIENFLSKLK